MCRRRNAVAACAVVALVASLSTPAAHAQRVAIATAATGGPASTDLLDLVSGRTQHISDQPADQAFFTADGSVLVWHPSGATSRRATLIDAGVDVSLPANFAPMPVVHPSELAVFGFVTGAFVSSVGRLDAAGLSVFTPCGAQRNPTAFDVTPDGRRLLVPCLPSAVEPASVVEIDSHSGAVINETMLPSSQLPYGVAVTSPDEFLLASNTGGHVRIERRRRSDGQVLASRSQQVTTITFRGNIFTPNPRRRDRAAIGWCDSVTPNLSGSVCHIETLDAASLDVVALLQAAGPPYPAVSFTADGSQALVSALASASLVDVATGQPTIAASAPANGFIVAAWGAEPLVPVLAAPSVAASTVALSWTLPAGSAAVTGYRLEAGYAPGGTAVSIDLGPAPATSIPGVPPGRYYARLRAMNANGVSASSNEVVIDVP